MAEALANRLPRRDCNIEARSAGLAPVKPDPRGAKALAEIGVDPSGQRSKHVREFSGEHFDYVITLCGEIDESCPVFRGGRYLTFTLPDPCRPGRGPARGDGLERFRHVRDALRAALAAWFGPEE